MIETANQNTKEDKLKTVGRNLLGLMLVSTGISHLTWARIEFRAQVPGLGAPE